MYMKQKIRYFYEFDKFNQFYENCISNGKTNDFSYNIFIMKLFTHIYNNSNNTKT